MWRMLMRIQCNRRGPYTQLDINSIRGLELEAGSSRASYIYHLV